MKKLFVALLCLVLFLGAEELRRLSTSGEGIYEATPDTVVINLGVQREGLSAEDAQSALRKALANVLEALKPLDLPAESVQTNSYSLYPIYKQRKDANGNNYNTEEIDRYRTYIRLSIEIHQVPQVGKITDTAIKAGVNRVEDISFTLKDDEHARNEALQMAIAVAQKKASLMAEKFNVELLSPISIDENWYTPSTRASYSNNKMMAMEAADAGFSLPDSKVQVQTRIQVSYEIAQKNAQPAPAQPTADATSTENTEVLEY